MKFPPMNDEDIANLLREAARKIKAGQPLRFPDAASGVKYLQGPVVVALLLGLADGKTLGQVLKKGRPKDRQNRETYTLVERARKRFGSYAKAYDHLAEQWHGNGKQPLRGEALAKAAANVKKAHQRARVAMKSSLDKIKKSQKEDEVRTGRQQAMAGKSPAEVLKGT